MELDAWTLIRFLHLMALAFFVGGQLLLVAAVVPVLRGGEEATMLRVARRFGIGSLVALTILIATGIAMADHYSRWGDDTLNAKLGLLVLLGYSLLKNRCFRLLDELDELYIALYGKNPPNWNY